MHNLYPHTMERIQKHRQSILQYAHEIGIDDVRVFEDTNQHRMGLLIKAKESLGWDYFGFASVIEEMVGDELTIITSEGAKENNYYKDIDLSHATPL